MSTMIFFCGLACSGKSTLARRLERDLPARRYSLDEHMRKQHADLGIFDKAYGAFADQARQQFLDEALEVARDGSHVLLDWNLWNRERRSAAARFATAVGQPYLVLFLDVPLRACLDRLGSRNAQLPPYAQAIPTWELERFASIFDPPAPAEALNQLRVAASAAYASILNKVQSRVE